MKTTKRTIKKVVKNSQIEIDSNDIIKIELNDKSNINYEILEDMNKKIKNIYHCSDIHIRTSNLRNDEYTSVFENLYEYLKTKETDNSVIVITGDIMHQKSIISPESFDLVESFIKNLSLIMPVILIAGNHDVNLANKTMCDILSRIFQNLEDRTTKSVKIRSDMRNIYYLKYSGVYKYNNILFGLSSLLDGQIIKSLDVNKYKSNEKTVGLYHGGVGKYQTASGLEMVSNISIETFKDYDMVLLGDIHKHQYLDSEKRIAYASSLIAQDFSETKEDHGLIEWNVLTSKSNYIKIKNEYSYVSYLIDKDEIEIDGKKYKYKKVQSDIIPEKARVRLVISEDTTENQVINMEKQLKIVRPLINIKQKEYIKSKILLSRDTNIDIKRENVQILLKKYLNNKNINNNKQTEILKLYDEIRGNLDMDSKEVLNDKWTIKKLSFNNMFGYGENNVIDMETYQNNSVIVISCPNSYGKSTIIDIITFALFSKIGRLSDGNSIPEEIVNENKDECDCSIEIQINDIIYVQKKKCVRKKISKSAVNAKGKSSNVHVDQELYCYNIKTPEKIIDLTKEKRQDTGDYLISLIGSYESFVQSSLCYQNVKTNYMFREMSSTEKIEYLQKILNLDKLIILKERVMDELKKSGDLRCTINGKIDNKSESIFNDKIVKLKTDEEKYRDEITLLEEQKKEIEDKIENKISLKRPINKNIENKKENQSKLEKVKKELVKINKILAELENEKNEQLNQLKLLNKIKDKKKIFKLKEEYETNKNIKIKKYQDDILCLTKKIKEIKDYNNIDQIKKDKLKLNEEMIFIDECLSQRENDKNNNNKIKKRLDEIKDLYQVEKTNNHMLKYQYDDEIKKLKLNVKKIETYTKTYLTNLNKEIEKINKTKSKNNLELNKLKNDLDILICEIDKIISLDENKIIKEYMTYNEIKIKNENNKNKFEKLISQIEENRIKITKLDSCNYNPKCKHCRENNFIDELENIKKIILPELEKDYNVLNKIINDDNKYLETNNINIEYNNLLIKKEERNKIENNILIIKDRINNLENENKNIDEQINLLNQKIVLYNENQQNKLTNNEIEQQIENISINISNIKNIYEDEYNKIKNIDIENTKNLEQIITLTNNRLSLISQINEKDNIIKEYETFKQIIENNNKIKHQIEAIEENIQIENTSKYNDYEILLEQIDINDTINTKIEKIDRNIYLNNKLCEDLKNKINIYEKIIVEIEVNENNIQFNNNIDNEVRLLRDQLNNVNFTINNLMAKINITKNKIEDIEIEIKKLDINLQELNIIDSKISNLQLLLAAFDKKGILLTVVSENLDYIQNRVNDIILTYIDKKIKLTVSVDNVLLTFYNNTSIRPTRLLGGMETFIVDLAFKIIFSEISQISSSNILFIDEGISVLDKEKISNFDNMVSFLESNFNKTFLITHIDTIQDFVSNKLDITKTNGYSHVNNSKKHNYDNNILSSNINVVKTKKTTKKCKTVNNVI